MAICPSRKELLAVAQMVLALLAILNYYKIDLFDTPMYDIRLLEHQCVNMAMAFISLFYALGTWFWVSNVSTTRMLTRLHCIIVYIILIILLFVTRSRYLVSYGPLVRGIFSHEIFDDEDERMATSLALMQGMLLLSGIIVAVHTDYLITCTVGMWRKRSRQQ